VHCDFPNKAKGQPDSNPEVGEEQLHRRFEVKGEDSKWSYLSWSGRGENESNSLAAMRPPKAKSTSILLVRGVRGVGGRRRQRFVYMSITSRLRSSFVPGFVPTYGFLPRPRLGCDTHLRPQHRRWQTLGSEFQSRPSNCTNRISLPNKSRTCAKRREESCPSRRRTRRVSTRVHSSKQ